MSDDRLTGILTEVAEEDIQVPAGISMDTVNLILLSESSPERAFPYVIALVFLVNMLLSMLFAGISGSATADTAVVGSILIPAMLEDGYEEDWAVGITAASSTIGAKLAEIDSMSCSRKPRRSSRSATSQYARTPYCPTSPRCRRSPISPRA